MSYDNEVGEGWGPGANQTGVVVYPLPAATAEAIGKQGVTFFDSFRPEWRQWRITPIADADLHGTPAGARNFDPGASPLDSFLDKYGLMLEVDASVAARINKAMTQPGSFYSHRSGGGMVIVSPASKEAYLIYAG